MEGKTCKSWLILAVLSLLLSHLSPALACSRVFWNDNPAANITGRTMDLQVNDEPGWWVFPRGMQRNGLAGPNSLTWTSTYGSVSLVANLFLGVTSDGLNEAGLKVQTLYLGGSKYEKRDQRPGVNQGMVCQFLLDSFKTVQEALNGLGQWQCVPIPLPSGEIFPVHYALEDASGDSAVIEYVKGRMVVYHGRQYRVMTNEPPLKEQLNLLRRYRGFGGPLYLPGNDDSKDRFVRGSYLLKNLPPPLNAQEAVFTMLAVMNNVSAPFSTVWDTWPTWWRSVTDQTNLVYYFQSTIRPNLIWVNLANFNFAPGAPPMHLDPLTPGLTGEVSGAFVPGVPPQ